MRSLLVFWTFLGFFIPSTWLFAVTETEDEIKLNECKPFIIKILDKDTQDQIKKEGTLLINCHNRQPYVPDHTTIHVVESMKEKICYSEKTCGNVKGWGGFFSVAGLHQVGAYSTLGQFLLKVPFRIFIPNGPQFEISFAVSYERISRSCSMFSQPLCIDRAK